MVELYVREKLNPLYKAWYRVWVLWWPFWRKFTGISIQKKLMKLGVLKEGKFVLDFGCGTGSFTIPAARVVGKQGRVFALDCFPRHLIATERLARKSKLTNVQTILSKNSTGLPDGCIDIVWMCDVFHEIGTSDKQVVLRELYRVLKADGAFLIYDGMKDKVLDYTDGLFSLVLRDDKLLEFVKKRR